MHGVYLAILLLSASLFADLEARFAYERGNCEILISSAIREIFMNEMRLSFQPLLQNAERKSLRYDLYTRNNPYKAQFLITGNSEVLRNSYFNSKWPVRFSIHGWAGKSTSCSNAAVKDAYLAAGNFNVIILDWSTHSMDLSYGRLSRKIPEIAAELVQFVRFLHREAGVAFENVYIVGHSAGAHIAGWAGKLLAPQRLGVIYALDPAGLTQLSLGPAERLSPNDAIYTESIHTDTTLLGNPSNELTHAAFFVNWGLGQPHCPNATAAEFDFACDHFSALYYFVETVQKPKSFGALQCRQRDTTTGITNKSVSNGSANHVKHVSRSSSSSDDLMMDQLNCGCTNGAGECTTNTFMGGEPAVPKNGTFYLSTRYKAPFGLGDVVRLRRPAPAKFLHSSFLSNKFFSDTFFSFHKT